MKKIFPIGMCLLVSLCGCNASDEDCTKLGDKFVELYSGELSEASKQLSPLNVLIVLSRKVEGIDPLKPWQPFIL
jgi:hypothetical protein